MFSANSVLLIKKSLFIYLFFYLRPKMHTHQYIWTNPWWNRGDKWYRITKCNIDLRN